MSSVRDLSPASDQELLACAREGDQDAWREMICRYRPAVYDRIYGMMGRHELAEDLTQETFVKALQSLDDNGPKRKPSAWLLRVASNTAIDYVRRKRPDSTRSDLTVTPGYLERRAMRFPTPPCDTPSGKSDRRELAAALKRALRRLRPEYRRCIVLFYVEGRSYDEIARIMNVSVGTVGTHLHRARAELRRLLQPLHPHIPTT